MLRLGNCSDKWPNKGQKTAAVLKALSIVFVSLLHFLRPQFCKLLQEGARVSPCVATCRSYRKDTFHYLCANLLFTTIF